MPTAAAGDPRNQRACGELPESARIPRKRPRPEGMAAGRRRLAAPQAMTFTVWGWGSPRRSEYGRHPNQFYMDFLRKKCVRFLCEFSKSVATARGHRPPSPRFWGPPPLPPANATPPPKVPP